jgi:hypothetical protein
MGMEPSHAYAKGDKYETHINKNVMGIREHPHGVWQIRSGDCVASSDPEDHARWLLGQLEPRASTVQEIMNRKGMYADVRVWIEMDGAIGSWTLKAETLSRLAKLCQDFNFSYIGTSEE